MASSSAAGSSAYRASRTERSPESFESIQSRNHAALVLQSFEKLSWYSFNRRESLQQTRLHFQNVVAGFTDADEAALVDLPMDNTQRQQDDRRLKTASSSKGKERSSGAGLDDSASPVSGSPGGKSKDRATSSRTAEASAKKKRKSGVR